MKRLISTAAVVAILCTYATAQVPGSQTYALMLNDAERAALVRIIAMALNASPNISPEAVYILNKINTAGVVTDKKGQTSEPKEESQ